jgi:hypothetical protein
MTSTVEQGEVFGLSDEVIARMRERFSDECKRLLEGMATRMPCKCGRGAASEEHDIECPIGAFREAAHAVWFWGHP